MKATSTTPSVSFNDKRLAVAGFDCESNQAVISDITTGVAVSITNTGYDCINGGTWETAPDVVHPGDRVDLQSRLDALDVKRLIRLVMGKKYAVWELSTLPL